MKNSINYIGIRVVYLAIAVFSFLGMLNTFKYYLDETTTVSLTIVVSIALFGIVGTHLEKKGLVK